MRLLATAFLFFTAVALTTNGCTWTSTTIHREALGQSCTRGYGESDTPPPIACAASCDCPKGMSCVSGTCQ